MYLVSAVFAVVSAFIIDKDNYDLYDTTASGLERAASTLLTYAQDMNVVMLLVFGFYFSIRTVDKFADLAIARYKVKSTSS